MFASSVVKSSCCFPHRQSALARYPDTCSESGKSSEDKLLEQATEMEPAKVLNNVQQPTMINGTPKYTANVMSTASPSRGCFGKGGCLRSNILTILTLLAVIAGVGLGFGLRQVRSWSKREVMYLNFPGEIFLRMLRCLILPLIVSSLVSALGCLDAKLTGKIGFRAVIYYLVTTVLAIILGIVLVTSIKPGVGDFTLDPHDAKPAETRPALTVDTLLDLIRNMFPPNIIQACTAQMLTVLVEPKNATNNTDPHTWDFKQVVGGGENILGLVVFSVVLGIVLGKMNDAGKPLLDVITSLSDSMMIITKFVIWFSPIGVLFLVAAKVTEMEDFGVIAGKVGLYTATVMAGLLIHGLITLPLMYLIIARKHPYAFLCNMTQALATAFGTSSSSATLPVTITCLEEKNGVDPRVSRFCLPVGATINMDGTALYEAVAAIFIAQARKVPLSVGSIIGISITATAASVGAAGIPQAGLVTMVMVLQVIGLPAEDVALILVVDWLVDRFRTAVNVLGDAFGAGIVERLSLRDLENLDSDRSKPTAQTEMTPL